MIPYRPEPSLGWYKQKAAFYIHWFAHTLLITHNKLQHVNANKTIKSKHFLQKMACTSNNVALKRKKYIFNFLSLFVT